MKVKIISGYSNPGGSTVAHINLTNLFNANGIDCTYYGPNDWHLDKCNGKNLKEVVLSAEDYVIVHYILLPGKPVCKKVILSCHETTVFEIKKILEQIKTPFWDNIHYVSESQKQWQGVDGVVIPNVLDKLKKKDPHPMLKTWTAGVIGSLDRHKQTHVSIDRAIAAGYEKVVIFGAPTDPKYFIEEIYPRLNNNVVYMGHIDDKQKMYDYMDVVYHSSLGETFNYVQAECKMVGVAYNGLDSGNVIHNPMSDDQIFDKWMQLLV